MKIYCLEDFKKEFDKLVKKKPYRDLEENIIGYFFEKSVSDLLSGTRLNNSSENPYIKKRLEGKGGYRFYFLVIIKNDALYLMFVHPKTGPDGAENINDQSKSLLYKNILAAIKSGNLYELTLKAPENNKLVFEILKGK